MLLLLHAPSFFGRFLLHSTASACAQAVLCGRITRQQSIGGASYALASVR
jgi:hypothetical protein